MLKKELFYEVLFKQFLDTLDQFKIDKSIFGDSGIVAIRVDDAVFYDAIRNHCLLIVLMKDTIDPVLFGKARIIRGAMENGHWSFVTSISINFESDYFEM